MVRVALRTMVHDVPSQDVITRDNVSVKVNAVVYYRVMDPRRAVVEVEQYHYATSQLAQTTLRSVLGQVELDDLLSKREHLNAELQQILDRHTDPWGIKVSMVEVKHVDLPVEMQRAMAKQAEAEREKRAKVIHAEGEFQASTQLAKAADIIAANPTTLQLRYLQTLTEIATEKNSTIIFPLPIDILEVFRGRRGGGAGRHRRPRPGAGTEEASKRTWRWRAPRWRWRVRSICRRRRSPACAPPSTRGAPPAASCSCTTASRTPFT
jgi:hypothetical protein